MSHGFLDIAATPSVRAAQAANGGEVWHNYRGRRQFDRFGTNEAAFIAERDSFYMATVSETGWPYVQHRGGRPGFIKVLDDKTLALADLSGNRQYISVGNLSADGRAALIMVDYARRARLKMFVRVETLALDADPALTAAVVDPEAKAERILRLRLEAFDWNCPQHITPRFTEQQVAEAVAPLRDRLSQLEAENAELRAWFGTTEGV